MTQSQCKVAVVVPKVTDQLGIIDPIQTVVTSISICLDSYVFEIGSEEDKLLALEHRPSVHKRFRHQPHLYVIRVFFTQVSQTDVLLALEFILGHSRRKIRTHEHVSVAGAIRLNVVLVDQIETTLFFFIIFFLHKEFRQKEFRLFFAGDRHFPAVHADCHVIVIMVWMDLSIQYSDLQIFRPRFILMLGVHIFPFQIYLKRKERNSWSPIRSRHASRQHNDLRFPNGYPKTRVILTRQKVLDLLISGQLFHK